MVQGFFELADGSICLFLVSDDLTDKPLLLCLDLLQHLDLLFNFIVITPF